jgi:serine/threonine-protein kinase RsbW
MTNPASWDDQAPIHEKNTKHSSCAKAAPRVTPASAFAAPKRSSITLLTTGGEIAEARRFVAAFVDDLTLAADAVLCVSEVATNAVLHSNSGVAGGRFTVSAECYSDGRLRIEVEDQGGGWTERAKTEGQHLGLMIVNQLSSAWGIEGDGGKRRTVWFELSLLPAIRAI